MKKPAGQDFRYREIRGFLHNAQLAAADYLPEESIDLVIELSNEFIAYFRESIASKHVTKPEMVAVLASTAYWIFTEGDREKSYAKQKKES